MNMLIFVCVIAALLSSFGDSAEIVDNGISDVTCLETETECASGCCPYTNATCCSETGSCCRQGAVCLGPLDVCLGLKSDGGEENTPALYSERASRLREVAACPSGTTLCYGGCCTLPNAVCCADRLTCCPHGYVCLPDKCIRDESVPLSVLNRVLMRSSVMSSSYSAEKPIPKKYPVSSRAGGPCCQTAFGFKCCPDFWICTPTGCIP